MQIKTAELYDEFGDELELVEPILKSYGDRNIFSGEVFTLKLFEDESPLRRALQKLGKGRVLVVDGAGSLRTAILDETLARLAMHNAWEGVIINGCIRDAAEIAQLDIGIRALNTCPVKIKSMNESAVGIPVRFAGQIFRQGQYLYADEDGILIAKSKLF